jgi:hypothetical protein
MTLALLHSLGSLVRVVRLFRGEVLRVGRAGAVDRLARFGTWASAGAVCLVGDRIILRLF